MRLCWDVVVNLSDEAGFGIGGQTEAGFHVLAAREVSVVVELHKLSTEGSRACAMDGDLSSVL